MICPSCVSQIGPQLLAVLILVGSTTGISALVVAIRKWLAR